jgi:hypothetical protein
MVYRKFRGTRICCRRCSVLIKAIRWIGCVYLEGEVHARRDEHNLDDYVYIARAGDPATEISGKTPFSRMKEMRHNGSGSRLHARFAFSRPLFFRN